MIRMYDTNHLSLFLSFQHNQRFRPAAEGGTQAVPGEGAASAAQGQGVIAVPRPARVLRRAVPREGRLADGAGRARAAQVLAKDVLPEGGDVPGGDRGNSGRDRAAPVRQDPGAAVPADRQVRVESALSGTGLWLRLKKAFKIDRVLLPLF